MAMEYNRIIYMKFLVKCSLLLSSAIATAFASCSSEDDLKVVSGYVPLDIAAVSAASNTQTRAAIDATAFPVSDAASIGLFVTDESGAAYNGQTAGYSNVAYTKAADATAWSCASPILLSSTQGKLYGYYPHSADATDATAIPVVSSVDGDDYMYLSSPTASINVQTPMPVNITMQHALSRLDITFVKSETVSSASLSSFTLTGDGVATSGTMNILEGGEITATKASAGFTYSPASAVALSASNTYKCLLVPATQEAKDLTISCDINDVTFSKTLTCVSLKPATRTAVTLTLTGTGVEVSNVSVTGWTTNEAPGVEAQTITATVAPFIDEDGNSVEYYTFQWQENDQIGIFPLDKAQMAFDVKEANGSTATLDGGSWGVLRPEYSYASYYPFSEDNYHSKISELPVAYVGQEMDGNNTLAHVSKYDFVASAPAKTSAEGTVNLDLKHLGCYTLFMLTLPEPGSYKYLALSCDDPVFVHEASYDLSAATPALTPKKSYNTYRIDLKNVTATVVNQRVDIPIMFAPVNLSGKTITLSMLKNDGKVFTTTVGGKDMVAGKAYGYTPTSAFTEKEEQIIAKMKDGTDFNQLIKQTAGTKLDYTKYLTKDYLVKKVVFDYRSTVSSGTIVSTNDSPYPIYANYADGVIIISTEAERISMTSVDYMFYGFNNLQSIDLSGIDTKNVTSMYDMFRFCESLTNLDLSGIDTQNVTNMEQMFRGCESLTSLDLSGFNTQNVTNMSEMFWACESLKSLDLTSFNTQNVTNMSGMFMYCYALNSLDLSGFNTQNVTNMSEMFHGCESLTSLDLSGFNTQNVTDMSNMFYTCSYLTSLDLGTSFIVCDKKEKMCFVLARYSHSCTLSCTATTKEALSTGTSLDSNYITWYILP